MRISKLTCRNFRSISRAELEPVPKLNVFVGSNAQGKTNILESIYMFIAGRSFRTTKKEDLINWDSSNTEVYIELIKKEITYQLYLHIDENKKTLTIDGVNRKKISDLLGYLNVVSFFPRDLSLVSGSPRLRREFIDLEISQVIPSYYKICQDYNRVLKQRNLILKNGSNKAYSSSMLSSFNDQMIELGANIIRKRLEMLYKLSILAKLSHRQLTDAQENFTMKYVSNIGIDESLSLAHKMTKEQIVDLYAKKVQQVQEKERYRKTSLAGPHLDDIGFYINNHDVRRFGSQGQQRTTVLALKLAELQFMKSETGEMPILILDDVLSELDRKRQTLLLETAAGQAQTFVATTDIGLLVENIRQKSTIYVVNNGVITRQ